MSVKHYEMQWDCQFCGTTKLLGKTHRFCPHCGAPQNPASRYYPSDEDKVAVEDHEYAGRDRVCSSCGELNSAASDFCQQCGAPMEGAEEAGVLGEQVRSQGDSFESSGSRDVVKEEFDSEMERIGLKKKKNEKKGFDWRIGAVIAAVLVIIAGGIFVLTAKKEADLLVTGHEWSREIQIEEYQNVSG